ncbi:MAG: hypothetical protein FWE57_07285 [Chitinispirillia bacterium]|nr:hypothetical protein [Chitinispirillia bacterium]
MTTIKMFFAVMSVVLLAAVPSGAQDTAASTLELYFFGPGGCMECENMKKYLLRPLQQELGERISIEYYDTDDVKGIGFLLSLEKKRGLEGLPSQVLFFPDTVLGGSESIMANTRAMVEERLRNPLGRMSIEAEMPDSAEALELIRDRLDGIVLGALIAAAFVDSINPCAFAAMIFLVSFLAAQKRKRREIVIIGVAFVATVFVTYLLLGLGLFKFVSFLDGIKWLSPVIKWTSVAFAGTIGIISFVDAFRFKKSGSTKDVKLQLPKKLKMLTHTIISKYMRGKRLVAGTIIAAFLVTLVDAVCTAEVYLPMIVIMVQNSSGMTLFTLILYLILYNFIFVLPLIAILTAAYYGITWNKMASMTQKNLTRVKILFGTVMIALALVLAFAMK